MRALHTVERGFDGTIEDAINSDTIGEAVEGGLRRRPVGTNTVAPEPAGRGQFEDTGKSPVIGQEQKALGIDVEPSNGDHAGHFRRQSVEHGAAARRIAGSGHQSAPLVIEPQPRPLPLLQGRAVDFDSVRRADIDRRRGQDRAIEHDPAGGDPLFRLTARTKPGPRQNLGDALAIPLGWLG